MPGTSAGRDGGCFDRTHYVESSSFYWMPACAGMTAVWAWRDVSLDFGREA
jgi:hypothetical protein